MWLMLIGDEKKSGTDAESCTAATPECLPTPRTMLGGGAWKRGEWRVWWYGKVKIQQAS